ncbi:MAG TPA: hypothetical protein VF691_01400 [Cytophagaceae bacterium]|jgi:hypothetical protein
MHKLIVNASFLVLIALTSFTPKGNLEVKGTFSCYINDKPFILEGVNARMRTVTGGYKQLSISNDMFTSFFFINPEAKEFQLKPSNKKEAVVRYTNPVNLNLYYPNTGIVKINVLDEKIKTLSGEFEMELMPKEGVTGKKIKVTQGKFLNIPIIYN